MATSTYSPARLGLRRRLTSLGMALRESPAASASGRPTLLYIHGLGESAYCFEDLLVAPRLADYRQLAPDLLNYGKSLWAPEPLDLEGHAVALLRLLDEQEIDWVVLVGHSMGGVIGLRLGQLLGPRLAGFVNIEGNVSLADCTFSSQVAGLPLADWLSSGQGAFLERLYAGTCLPPAPERDAAVVLRAYAASIHMADPRAYHRNSGDLVAISRQETIPAELAALGKPLIYVYGAPRGTQQHSRKLLAHAGIELREIAPAGHWPFLDQPAAFLDVVTDFLDALAP